VDGRTDGDALQAVIREGEYEEASSQFGYDAWACGRATMQEIWQLRGETPAASPYGRPDIPTRGQWNFEMTNGAGSASKSRLLHNS
jgi:hypothetical protein